MAIEVTPEFEGIAVRIDGALHLWFDRRKLLGIQSWQSVGRCQFFIEITLEGGAITADYDSREKWMAILTGLEPIVLNRRERSR